VQTYEDFLRKALSEGWKDPIRITDLEIKAFEQGRLTERKRILSILSDISDGVPIKNIDVQKYFEKK
jgi:hypothetical protein